MSGYQSIYQSKIKDKQKGSGLAIYIADSLEFCETVDYNQCSENLEALFVTIKNTSEVLTVGVVYRPPSGTISAFVDEYENLLKNLPNKNAIICGDFNMNLHKPNNEYESMFYSHGYIPTISLHTHEKPGCEPSCIDNIFINSWDAVLQTGVLCNRVSAHFPIFCTLNIEHSSAIKGNRATRYDTCSSNMDVFIEKLSNSAVLHTDIICGHDRVAIEDEFESFATNISNLVDECFIVPQTAQTSKRNKFVNPWITPGIIASVNRKNFLYKKWKKSITKTNKDGNHAFYLDYSNFRRKLKKIIKHAKKLYYGRKFESYNGNIKKTWQLINELRGKSKHSTKPSFMINGNLVQNRRVISNQFNKYFTSIAKNMNEKLDEDIDHNNIIVSPPETYIGNGKHLLS